MATKILTLTMEHSSIEQLKKYARENKTTPSKIVEDFFRNYKLPAKSTRKKRKV
jgi:hypothetical protein